MKPKSSDINTEVFIRASVVLNCQQTVLVSVIVPVYNAEKYLSRCLNSLVSQTLHEIEILCVNDGSTDSSLEILNDYAKNDTRIYVFNQENKGPGIARNTALDNAKGKYILFCDADDALDPEACRECSVVMESNQVDIVLFNANVIEIDRKASNVPSAKGEYFSIVRSDNAGVLNKKAFIRNSIVNHIWQYSFSRDIINRFNLRFTHYKLCEDLIFFYCYIMLIQNGYFLKKNLYNYYAYKGSLTYIAYKENFWLGRFIQLPKVLWNCFKFGVENKMPFRIIYSFCLLFVWLKSRLKKR